MTAEHAPEMEGLARAHGVSTFYRDLRGQRRDASPEGLLAVLGALGAHVRVPEDAPRALVERQHEIGRRVIEGLAFNANNLELLQKLEASVAVAKGIPFEVNLREVQSIYYAMLQNSFPRLREAADHGDERARQWVGHFTGLGEQLAVKVA